MGVSWPRLALNGDLLSLSDTFQGKTAYFVGGDFGIIDTCDHASRVDV